MAVTHHDPTHRAPPNRRDDGPIALAGLSPEAAAGAACLAALSRRRPRACFRCCALDWVVSPAWQDTQSRTASLLCERLAYALADHLRLVEADHAEPPALETSPALDADPRPAPTR